MKRIISFVLATIMIMTTLLAVPFSALAESGSCGSSATYTLDTKAGSLVISGTGAMTDYSKTSKAPWNNPSYLGNIKSITISNGITHIGDFAFQQLSQVESITIADTVKTIGNQSFDSCAVGAIPIKMNIPASVESIGTNALRGMSKVTAFNVSEDNKSFSSVDGVIYDKNKTTLILCPCRVIPEVLRIPVTVTKINAGAFYKLQPSIDIFMPIGLNTVEGAPADFLKESKGTVKIHYPEGSAFDWNIFIKNINNNNITGICYNPEACEDDISNYKHEVVTPTCTSGGYTLHACDICGYEYADEYTDAIGHSFKSILKKATMSKDGSITQVCEHCNTIDSVKVIPYVKTFTMATTGVYNGKVKAPTVTVTGGNGKKLIKNTDYTVTYSSGRKNVGKYAVKVTLKGNYSGTKTLYFTIKPSNTSITKITAGSKKFTVKLKKYTTQTTGYQIQYATNRSFKSAKTVTMSNKTTSKTISKLAGKKKYWVRVRTYKTVNGTKYYSAWSKAKTVTTKK